MLDATLKEHEIAKPVAKTQPEKVLDAQVDFQKMEDKERDKRKQVHKKNRELSEQKKKKLKWRDDKHAQLMRQ